MSTKNEIVSDLQRIVDAGRDQELTGEARVLLDAAIKDGLIKPRQGMMGAVQEAISPRFQEDFPEVESALRMPTDPREAQAYIDQLSSGPLSSSGEGMFGKYVGAQVSEDRYGRPTVQTRTGEQRYLNRGGLSAGDIGRAGRGVMGFVEEAAPFLASPATTLVKAALQQGGIGLATEMGKVAERAIRGEDLQTSRLATTPLIVMAGDVFGRGVFNLGGKIYTRLTGKQGPANVIDDSTGQFKPEAIREMRQNSSTADIESAAFDELVDMAESGSLGLAGSADDIAEFTKRMDEFVTSGQATQAQAERYNLFKRMGLEPTRAQVTRSATDFQTQQELAKTSGPVLSSLEQQQKQLGRAFEAAEERTGGAISSESSPIQQAVVNKANKLTTDINVIYKEAGDSLPDVPSVDIRRYVNEVLRNKSLETKSGGTYSALRGQLERDFDLKIPSGAKTYDQPFLVTPKQAETIRQSSNDLYSPNSALDSKAGVNNKIVREVKEVLDFDVARSVGKDAFEKARSAYQEFRRGLDPDQLSRFSKNTKSLIRDLLEQKIAPQEVFRKVVASRGYFASDLRALKNYIVGRGKNINPEGAKAWSDLRAETLSFLRTESFGGPLGELGNQTLTRNRLESAVKKIGMDKLKEIFNKSELKFIKDVMQLAKVIEPVGGTAMGKGPSAQAVKQLEDVVRGMGGRIGQGLTDLLGGVIKSVKQSGQEREVLSGAAPIMSDVVGRARRLRPEIPATGGALGAGTAAATTEEMR